MKEDRHFHIIRQGTWNPIRPVTVAIFAVLLISEAGWSWGRLGHRVASEMAEARLSPRALSAIRDLLGPGVTLADISTWADEQRNPRSGAWHYVDVPIAEYRYKSRYCPPGGCVVSKIEDFKRVLRDPTANKTERQQALKFLVHFIEDLSQPLHVGDTSSRGGNLIQIRFYNVGANLHRVWDSQIMERHTTNEQVWLWDLNGVTNPKLAAEWSKGTPEDWATDTLQVAKKAYCLLGTNTVIPSGTKLGDEYCNMALPLIQKQLAKAGVRVVAVLNEIFKKDRLR